MQESITAAERARYAYIVMSRATCRGVPVGALPTILLLAASLVFGCSKGQQQPLDESQATAKAQQEYRLTHEQIEKNDPAGLLKLWKTANESNSAEDAEIASEEIRGYLYSKTEFWVSTFATIDFDQFKKAFEGTDFDEYRFTSDGALPVAVVAERLVPKLKAMKAKNQRERALADYLVVYYGRYLKTETAR